GNTEKARQAGAGGNEDRVIVLVAHQFVDGDALADHDVGFKLYAHAAQVLDVVADDGLGQTKFRYAVNEDAAKFVQGFKDVDAVTFLDQVTGGGKPGRAAAHNRNRLAGAFGDSR